jgi:hypothetical protein
MVQHEEIYFSIIQHATQHLSDCPDQFEAKHSSSTDVLAMVLRPAAVGELLTVILTSLYTPPCCMAAIGKSGQLTAYPTLNAVPCSSAYNAVHIPTLAILDCSPACLLHTRDITRKSVQTELELHMTVSIRLAHHKRYAMTYSCHAEVSEDTASLCAHDTAVLDLCRAGVAVHLAELELRLRAGALRKRGIANYVAKSLSVRPHLSVSAG